MSPALPSGSSRRERIFRRDAYRCVYCGRTLDREELTLDHVEPRARGGDRSEGNLVTACRECNARKADLPAWDYLAERHDQRANFLTLGRAVWPRLRRAVREAAERARERRAEGP